MGAPVDPERLLEQGRVDEALAAVMARVESHPDDVAAHELFIDFLLNLGRAGEAWATYDARVKADPGNPDAHYLLGRATPDARVARGAYEKALRLNPEHARSHMGVAAVHMAVGRVADAREAYLRAATLDPTLAEAWLGVLRADGALGDPAVLLADARAAQRARPQEPQVALALAEMVPEEASSILAPALAAHPEHPGLLVAEGRVRLREGRGADAQARARKALASDPSSPDARRLDMEATEVVEKRIDLAGLTRLAELPPAPSDALAALDAAAAAHPRSVIVRLVRASTRKQAGDLQGAIGDLREAVRLDPAHVEARASLGRELLADGRASEALPLLLATARERPWDVHLVKDAGDALIQNGRAPEGVAMLRELVARHPGDMAAVGALARGLLDVGQGEAAYVLVRDALGVRPDPWLATMYVMVAEETGHQADAATFVEGLATRSGSAELAALAAKLRARAPR